MLPQTCTSDRCLLSSLNRVSSGGYLKSSKGRLDVVCHFLGRYNFSTVQFLSLACVKATCTFCLQTWVSSWNVGQWMSLNQSEIEAINQILKCSGYIMRDRKMFQDSFCQWPFSLNISLFCDVGTRKWTVVWEQNRRCRDSHKITSALPTFQPKY